MWQGGLASQGGFGFLHLGHPGQLGQGRFSEVCECFLKVHLFESGVGAEYQQTALLGRRDPETGIVNQLLGKEHPIVETGNLA